MNDRTDSWDALSARWQTSSDNAPAADLGQLIAVRQRRGTLRLWAVAALEFLVVVGIVAFTVSRLRDGATPLECVHLVSVWVVVAVTVAFAIRNRRGLWRPSSESTVEYLSLCELRAKRKLRTARFVLQLISVQATWIFGLLVWNALQRPDSSRLLAEAGLLVAVLIVYVSWALWFRHRAHRELESTRLLRHALDAATPVDSSRLL